MATQDPLVGSIIESACTVAKEMGYGFPVEVYGNALAVELRKANLTVDQGRTLDVFYEGVCVGTSRPDLIVEDRVLVAVMTGDGIDVSGIAQCRNDLKAACLVSGLMFDFGCSKLEVRKVALISEEGAEEWVTDVINLQ